MSREIPESDWRRFRQIHTELRDLFCSRVLEEIQAITTSTEGSTHDRYIRVYRLIEARDRELGDLFNDFRRSRALQQLLVFHGMGLLADSHVVTLTEETQALLRAFGGGNNSTKMRPGQISDP